MEGLVNALIHRNYLEIGSEIHIDMFDDRMEIYSPGGMCDGSRVQERDLMRVPSRRRNPVIADIFNRLKYMERRGSGFKKILSDYRGQPQFDETLEPEFYSDNDCFWLILKNLNYNGTPRSDELQHSTVEANIDLDLYIRLKGFLSEPRSRAELQEFCNIGSRHYFRTKILAPLVDAKIVKLTIPEKPTSSKQKYVWNKD